MIGEVPPKDQRYHSLAGFKKRQVTINRALSVSVAYLSGGKDVLR